MQLPKRLVECLQQLGQIPDVSLKQLNAREQQALIETLTEWRVQPNGTEGYRTAEVTLGGVNTDELSSRTMEARKVPGLYFIGEVMDVTGWLGAITSSGLVERVGMRAGAERRITGLPDQRAVGRSRQFRPRKYWAILK